MLREGVINTQRGGGRGGVCTGSSNLRESFENRFVCISPVKNPKHKKALSDRYADGQTTLSRHVWEQRDKGKDPVVAWKYLEKNVPDFNPVSGLCKLCTREKFQIVLNPSVATLNHRTEMFASCRHKRS